MLGSISRGATRLFDAGHEVLDPLYVQAAISRPLSLIAATVWYAFSLVRNCQGRDGHRLLRNILPDSVVPDDLRRKPDRAWLPTSYDDVTVMFADISGFVALSRELGPQRVVELLNTGSCGGSIALR